MNIEEIKRMLEGVKYRKKPVVVDAVQWFKEGDHPEVRRCGTREFTELSSGCTNINGYNWDAHGVVGTLEGRHLVTPGDYIITGIKGELYPCKPDIFSATYEPADSTDELSRLREENEDLKRELNRCDCGACNWCNGQTYYQMKQKLQAAESRIEQVRRETAEECAKIADNFDNHCWRNNENQEWFDSVCDAIAKEIGARFGEGK